MAQLQFRSDDTIKWKEGFGNGKDGDVTISANKTDDSANTTFSGAAGTKTGTGGDATGFEIGDFVKIIQMQGSGNGTWQYNKIENISGNTFTFKYDLVANFSGKAQIVECRQYNNITINSGVTLSAPDWDGNTGGVLGFFYKGTFINNGTVDGTGKGFRGGISQSNDPSTGYQGESYLDTGGQSGSANEGGGGGGRKISGDAFPGGAGGGGYATSGANGTDKGGGGNQAGVGGGVYGTTELTSIFLGSGGGGAAGKDIPANINGGDGGAILEFIGKEVTGTGSILNKGSNGTSTSANEGGGAGAGSGGSTLFKGETIDLSSMTVSVTGGTGGTGGGQGGTGGNGGNGRAHADYSKSFTGSINSRLDATIKSLSGVGALFFSHL